MRSMTTRDYVLSGFMNDVIHHRLYFGSANPATASVIRKDEYRLWANGVGQQEANISTQALVTLQDCDTSLQGENGIIPNGNSFLITAIGIHIEVANVQATTPFTDNAVSSIDITPVVQANAIPLVKTLRDQCTFELYRNADSRLERGNIAEYPCSFGSQAAIGGGSASVPAVVTGDQAAYSVESNVIIGTNGMVFRPLSVYQKLEQLDQFYGIFKVNREIDLAATALTGCIDFYLVGLAGTDFKTTQLIENYTAQGIR